MRINVFSRTTTSFLRSGALQGLLCAATTFLLLSGCGTTKETRERDGKASDEEVREFESTFHPSDYDPMKERPTDRHPRRVDTSTTVVTDEPVAPASQENIQGFRVQVFSTIDIDAARAKKAEFEGVFPDEWFYLEYHAPTYKLRAGNFQNRFEAERFARMLTDQGYPEAWAVPEKVFKAPGKRPLSVPVPDLPKE